METRRHFYRNLGEWVELVVAFKSYSRMTKSPFVFDHKYGPLTSLARLERAGPVVKIYKLNRSRGACCLNVLQGAEPKGDRY